MNREVTLTIAIVVSTIVLIVGILCFYTNNEIQRLDNEIKETRKNEIISLASRFALRMQYVIAVMELTGQTLPMSSPPTHANLISNQLKGIPENADIEKREVVKKMLDKKLDLDYVFYAMPNGDIYFLEPYQSQTQLSQLNFAFRDWYHGAITTGSTYVSEVYVSANEKHNVIGIAVPIYSDTESHTLNGIFVGALHLGALQKSMAAVSLGKNQYFLIIDHNDNIVADSRRSESDMEIRKFALDLSELQQDDVVLTTKTIEGKDNIIAAKTIQVGTHTWLAISIQPQNDAFVSSISHRNEIILIIIVIVVVTSVAGFFMVRRINTNRELSNKLLRMNLELEQKTEQIKQIDIEKDEFAAMVTHELKTPLVPIIGYCKMFKTEMFGKLSTEQKNAIDAIDENAKNLEKIISDMLDVRKLELDRVKFHLEDLSVEELFNKLSTSYKQVLQESGKEFIIESPAEKLQIKTDKARFRQVFDNLISNAIKFTPVKEAKIIVGCKKINNKIIFYVKDNGVGIPLEEQSNLFRKFYQIDTSERRKAGGTGLGLAICKGIIEKLGGRIYLESDGITGSSFYVEFDTP